MNRRDFLKSILAISAGFTLPLDLAVASDQDIENLWPEFERNPSVFCADSHGTLTFDGYPEPETNNDVYNVSLAFVDTPAKLADEIDSCYPLTVYIEQVYSKHRTALLDDLQDSEVDLTQRYRLEQVLAIFPEEPEEGWHDWVESADSATFRSLRESVADWLGYGFDSEYFDHFNDYASGQSSALSFFRSMDWDDLKRLGVVIVEGECPGSSYYAAELRIPVEDANAAAKLHRIPIRFTADSV